jgi:hypothetical protein
MRGRKAVLAFLDVLDEQHQAGNGWVLDRHGLLSLAEVEPVHLPGWH